MVGTSLYTNKYGILKDSQCFTKLSVIIYSTYFFIPVFLTPLIHQNAPYIHWTWESIINTRSQTRNKIRLSVREKGKNNLNIQEFLVLIYYITLCNKWGGLLVEYFDSSNSLNMWTRNVRNFKKKVTISWYHASFKGTDSLENFSCSQLFPVVARKCNFLYMTKETIKIKNRLKKIRVALLL